MSQFVIDARFCGPPGCANGGYFAGLVAQHAASQLRVRLMRPVPLTAALTLLIDRDGGCTVTHEQQTIATAAPTTLDLAVPPAPDYLQVLEASRRFIGFERHAFPACFVCGPERARGDGLRIFAGAVAGSELVAAPWVADGSLADRDGKVRPEFMSAALDCPGYFAARSDGVPMLLGEFTAHVDRCVHVDEPCTVIGWRLGTRGRKHEVGTALFDEDGELCARARALWIEPKAPPPLQAVQTAPG